MVSFPILKKKIFGSGSSEMQEIKNKNELDKFNFKNIFYKIKLMELSMVLIFLMIQKIMFLELVSKKKFDESR